MTLTFRWVLCLFEGGIRRLRRLHRRRQHPPRIRNRRSCGGAFMDLLLRNPLQLQSQRLPHHRSRPSRRLQPTGPNRRRCHRHHLHHRRPQHQRLLPHQLHRLHRPHHRHTVHHHLRAYQRRHRQLQTFRS